MPTVALKSYQDQRVDICYDIYGIGETLKSQSLRKASLPPGGTSLENGRDERTEGATTDHSSPPRFSTPFRVQNGGAATRVTDDRDRQSGFRQDHSSASCKEDVHRAGEKVIFIAGLGARGRTEFFQHVVDHLASLKDISGRKLLSICTFDNRGIGGSTVFKHKKDYSTLIMAHDTLALMTHLKWEKAHIIGMSMGGMIANKIAAHWPDKVASMTIMSATKSGWHMLAGLSRCPFLATVAGSGPLTPKIKANLRFNFSDGYLARKDEDGRTFKQILVENTHLAIEEGNTKHFLAEGQPSVGREGHLTATGFHRMTYKELRSIRESNVPSQLIVGRYDRLARMNHALSLAKHLRAPLLVLEAAHAGLVLEALPSVIASLEAMIFGNGHTTKAGLENLRSVTSANMLSKPSYAREFASTFGPGRVSFKNRTEAKDSDNADHTQQ